MKINAFFANRLNAPLHNPRQSWGAFDEKTNRVYLRVSSGSIDEYGDGKEWVTVYDPDWRKSGGHKERLGHLNAITQGAEGFAVVVNFNDNGTIDSFDDNILRRIGNVAEDGGLTYAEIIGEISVDELISGQPFSAKSKPVGILPRVIIIAETTKEQLVDARLGQGAFRSKVLQHWDYLCAVTGVKTQQVIRASHIRPWRDSTNEERLDPYNGLPLVASLDCLFDCGYVSFDANGSIMISSKLCKRDRVVLSVDNAHLRRAPHRNTAVYLKFHREVVFQP